MRLVSRNPDVNMWSRLDAALPEVKRQLAELADCGADEITLNRNSTEGLCTATFGLPLAAGDAVPVSAWDYPSVRLEPMRSAPCCSRLTAWTRDRARTARDAPGAPSVGPARVAARVHAEE